MIVYNYTILTYNLTKLKTGLTSLFSPLTLYIINFNYWIHNSNSFSILLFVHELYNTCIILCVIDIFHFFCYVCHKINIYFINQKITKPFTTYRIFNFYVICSLTQRPADQRIVE